ncbi:Histidine phosphatase superfamily (branch 1) [Roseomonas rosea]|uniref:Histidine phosphatase superfamily (Branch 1) n=1 Tax=Muricoccus roseus TaxID=198092 RepID=A0A1M6F3B8_9PROT|nr:histidine phosphatase family protein [Roseomonas rosea]SHI92208.1 Histidine phosphatase superfamily (branch 1) [Roseomonas rosea]
MRITPFLIAGLLAGACLARAQPSPPMANPAELASALREGGLVLYMRHPATESAQTDAEALDFADCRTQRNLSEAGRRVAREIGAALRDIRVPVTRAVTSEYCRAREAAVLMDAPPAETEAALNDGGRMLAKGPDSPQAQALRDMLRRAAGAGRRGGAAHRGPSTQHRRCGGRGLLGARRRGNRRLPPHG